MNTITLHIPQKYRRSDKIINTTHPENWEELTSSQFIALVRAINGNINEDDLLVEMLDLPHSIVKKLDTIQRYHLGCLLEFMKSKAPVNTFILKSEEGLLPPKDGLQDVSFGEFIHIDTFFLDYQNTNSKEALSKLISCLYVSYSKKGERPVFTGLKDNPKALRIHPIKQEAIAMNYSLVRNWLEKAYPEIFPNNDVESKKSKENSKKSNGWLDVFDSIVGDDWVNDEKYFNMSCTEVLRRLNKKIIASRKSAK